MTPLSWPCPSPGGGFVDEYSLSCDKGRAVRLLIVPPLFDEANRMRRLLAELLRRLDRAGIDGILPDLPGSNESLQPLASQSPEDWSSAMTAAASQFGATHALGVRGGCLFTPTALPSWHYAPVKAANLLRSMLRTRILAAREAGREATSEHLMQAARTEGIDLTGHQLSARFIREFEPLAPSLDAKAIVQEDVGGSGLWLRAEPGDSAAQVDALAAILIAEMAA